MVAEREKLPYGSRIGKMIGSARAFVRVVRHPRRFFVSVEGDNGAIEQRTAGVVISNNPFGKGHLPYADALDEGVLGVYVTTARGWLQLVRVTVSAAFGTSAEHPLVTHLRTPRATVRLGRHDQVPTSLDGELVRLKGPLEVESVAGGLKVLAPKAPNSPGGMTAAHLSRREGGSFGRRRPPMVLGYLPRWVPAFAVTSGEGGSGRPCAPHPASV
jgi:diacylglycerol kinase family enzyme